MDGDKYSLLLRSHTTVMLMYVVDHPVAQIWWQLIPYNILSGREVVYIYIHNTFGEAA